MKKRAYGRLKEAIPKSGFHIALKDLIISHSSPSASEEAEGLMETQRPLFTEDLHDRKYLKVSFRLRRETSENGGK